MAKIFDKLIQNSTISIHFFVKWQFSFRVTFQAFYFHEKFSSFCWQHHTLKSTTVWMFSLVVWCSAKKTWPFPGKIAKNMTEAERSSSSMAILSSFAAEVDKISKYWPKLNIQTANCCPCCSLSKANLHRSPKTLASAHWPILQQTLSVPTNSSDCQLKG